MASSHAKRRILSPDCRVNFLTSLETATMEQSFPELFVVKIEREKDMKSAFCAIGLLVLSSAATFATAQDASTQTPDQTAWTVLNIGLENNSTDLRVGATRVLGELNGNAKAEDAALSALKNDKQADVRAAAAQALGEMGAK